MARANEPGTKLKLLQPIYFQPNRHGTPRRSCVRSGPWLVHLLDSSEVVLWNVLRSAGRLAGQSDSPREAKRKLGWHAEMASKWKATRNPPAKPRRRCNVRETRFRLQERPCPRKDGTMPPTKHIHGSCKRALSNSPRGPDHFNAVPRSYEGPENNLTNLQTLERRI